MQLPTHRREPENKSIAEDIQIATSGSMGERVHLYDVPFVMNLERSSPQRVRITPRLESLILTASSSCTISKGVRLAMLKVSSSNTDIRATRREIVGTIAQGHLLTWSLEVF